MNHPEIGRAINRVMDLEIGGREAALAYAEQKVASMEKELAAKHVTIEGIKREIAALQNPPTRPGRD